MPRKERTEDRETQYCLGSPAGERTQDTVRCASRTTRRPELSERLEHLLHHFVRLRLLHHGLKQAHFLPQNDLVVVMLGPGDFTQQLAMVLFENFKQQFAFS